MRRLLKQVVVQVSKTVPLQTVLIVPFVLQTLVTVGLVGYFSFKNGQETVNDLASQLRRELMNRIEGKLQTYTEIPHNINRLNASTFAQGKIDVNAIKGEFPLWQQIQIYPTVSDIYCADLNGSLLGVRRNPANRLIELRSSNVATGHKLYGYTLDRNGKGDQLVSQGNKLFDARTRPWYGAAVTAGEPVWSEIYADFASQLPTITASTPIYNTVDKSLLGVCATDVFLPSEMGQFLSGLKIGKTGSAFILERSGRLVSTSSKETIMSSGVDFDRLPAVESRNPTVRATASYLRDHFKDLRQIQSVEQLDFNLNGDRQLVQVVPFKDAYGLDWLIVTVLPESDFMGQIHQNTHTTILLCLAALILGIIICILTSRWITRPIVSVSQSAKALARSEWDQTVEIERSGDLGELARSFNLVAHQMQISFTEMQSLNHTLAQNETILKGFLEAVQVGIGVLDATGRPYYVNQRGIELLGKGLDPAANPENLAEIYQVFLAGTDQIYPTERMPLVRALRGDRTRIDDLEIHQNDKIIPVEAWGTPIFDELGNVAYAITAFQDITERKRAEQLLADYNQILEQQVAERTLELEQEKVALQQSEAANRAMISAIPDLLIQMSQDGTYLEVVRSGNFQPFNLKQLKVGANVRDVLPPDIAQTRLDYSQLAIQMGELQIYEQRIVGDDRVYDQEVRIVATGANAVLVMIRDISDRKRAEEASILEERNRMAREIHDTLAQSFTGILVQLGAASQVLNDDLEATQAHLEMIDELARIGLAEARRSVTALRPQLLEEGDLDSALHRLVTQMRAAADTALIYEIRGIAYPLPAEAENNLLRIGQEALTNAIKYADASEIRVELVYEATQCRLRIKDDGRGFGVGSIPSVGFGLMGISERAEHIGAQLTIQSHPDQGTEIVVTVNKV
jgi:PAS domain S-box-containing protein